MSSRTDAPLRDTPAALTAELARYGGLNPYGEPRWRVVLAENVRDEAHGTMTHMPLVTAEIDPRDAAAIEPERYSSGDFELPRYACSGWILERWFPASTWGSQAEWEAELADDGVTRRQGAFPRHGDWYMVGDGPYDVLPGAEFWKEQIRKELARQEALPGDAAAHLTATLYHERVRERERRERFLAEVNAVHRGVSDPLLATISPTAQKMRNAIAEEQGLGGYFGAG